MSTLRLLVAAAMILILVPRAAHSQEVYAGGGLSMDPQNASHKSAAWYLSYIEELGKGFFIGFTWLNEGHLNGHHRDGPSLQLWYRHYLLGRSLSLSGAAGPYVYYDTIRKEHRTVNTHGVAPALSLAATWHFRNQWLLQLRTNWVRGGHGIDTLSATLGMGFNLDPVRDTSLRTEGRAHIYANEFGVMVGQSADNSYSEGHAAAFNVEYRRRLTPTIEWTAGWLNEMDGSITGRYGPHTQIYAVRDFFDARLVLGIGLGPYLAKDTRSRDITSVAALFTMSGAYRFAAPWAARLSWSRVTTHYHTDADVILAGLSYGF